MLDHAAEQLPDKTLVKQYQTYIGKSDAHKEKTEVVEDDIRHDKDVKRKFY